MKLQGSRLCCWRTRFCVWLMLFCTATSALSDTYSFASASLEFPKAKRMSTTTTSLSITLGKAPKSAFVRRVGGVAFDSEARPVDGLLVESLTMTYDPVKPDGERLVLTVNGAAVSAPLFDWQLLPIATYANGKTTSCFTLFGELEDNKELEKELLEEGHRILNYDAAFEDTLLGLRLFQMDVLLLDTGFATELPRFGGEFILGAGEAEPDPAANTLSLARYENERQKIIDLGEAETGGFSTDFQSYVICDQFVDIQFGVVDGMLALTGEQIGRASCRERV